jgi:hypothetical protein
VLSGTVHSDADQPRVQIRLRAQDADPLLLGAVEFLKPRDHLPDIRARSERGPRGGGALGHLPPRPPLEIGHTPPNMPGDTRPITYQLTDRPSAFNS